MPRTCTKGSENEAIHVCYRVGPITCNELQTLSSAVVRSMSDVYWLYRCMLVILHRLSTYMQEQDRR
jgi:hypothetical protein